MMSRHTATWGLPVHTAHSWRSFSGSVPSSLRRERWGLRTATSGSPLDRPPLGPPSNATRTRGIAPSHYVLGSFRSSAPGLGRDFLVFRSCGDEPNHQPRFYHSGDTSDLDFVLGRLIEAEPDRRIVIAGVSLGGNVLLKWLGELGDGVPRQVRAAAAVSVPFDLARGSRTCRAVTGL